MDRKTAWVTGGSRGVGRGIAVALGRAGWTVWVSARSGRAAGSTSHLPGSVEETAQAITDAGGRGIGVVCDHRDDDQVRALADRIEAEGGALHLLVNNAWAGYERLNAGEWTEWNAPFWQQPLALWDAMFDGGVRTHYVTSAVCAPLLRRTAPSAIVTVSMEVGARHDPHQGVAYSVAKAADDRLAAAMAGQLAADSVASVAVYPGLVRTEGVMQFAEHLDLSSAQTPEGVGRCVAALAVDPQLMSLTGQALHIADLAARYGVNVTD
ncbi:NAD(P)-dependent dehydrogenase (short-subunit alcohol dehydrogenase family) [Asanoa ferruginea]|uniref:NAD(P)-dependent dehydrogenase (Short-subunit alcohol dehydrogenase family) n=1 Tax=Asanoa ferruginea TaxID=53367 RepID=A0A3D9ZQM8_9ACTN|nr:SDR family NAD(P)-dependent oxidoreductase [Asanoa ferruginea]REF98944.1 NAD(P)-dependent dehydrogenase (short-subunit alcohol dehydrogenase family) [Asanoa ferruginea]GIF46374.1 oxidoreductase [Asanoa ferruginea]